MGNAESESGWRGGIAAYLGLVTLPDGSRRPRWARVISPGEDSSRREAAGGLLLGVLLLALVTSRVFGEPGWFRVVAALALLILLLSLVRIGRLYARLR